MATNRLPLAYPPKKLKLLKISVNNWTGYACVSKNLETLGAWLLENGSLITLPPLIQHAKLVKPDFLAVLWKSCTALPSLLMFRLPPALTP